MKDFKSFFMKLKLDELHDKFLDRKLDEIHVLNLILYPHYLCLIKKEFPKVKISASPECYTELISTLYDYYMENDGDPTQDARFTLIEKFVESSEMMKIARRTPIERLFTAEKLLSNDDFTFMDPNFLEVNFITDVFPDPVDEEIES